MAEVMDKFLFKGNNLNNLAARGFSNHTSSSIDDIFFTLASYGYLGDSFTYAKKTPALYPWSYGSFSSTPQYYYGDQEISFVPKGYAPDPKLPNLSNIVNFGTGTIQDRDNGFIYLASADIEYTLTYTGGQIRLQSSPGSSSSPITGSANSPIVIVDIVGAGGGGGGCDKDGWSSNYSTGGGGGSGAFCSYVIDLSRISSCKITLGASGAGGLGNESGSGGTGGSSSLAIKKGTNIITLCTCEGGKGGTNGYGKNNHGSGGSGGGAASAVDCVDKNGNVLAYDKISAHEDIVALRVARLVGSRGGDGNYNSTADGGDGGAFNFTTNTSALLLDRDYPGKPGGAGSANGSAGGAASFYAAGGSWSNGGYVAAVKGAGGASHPGTAEAEGAPGGCGFCLIHFTYQG